MEQKMDNGLTVTDSKTENTSYKPKKPTHHCDKYNSDTQAEPKIGIQAHECPSWNAFLITKRYRKLSLK